LVRAWKSRGDGRFGLGEVGSLDACNRRAGHHVTTSFFVPKEIEGAIADKTVALHDIDGDGLADIVIATNDGIDVLTHARPIGIDHFDFDGLFEAQHLHIPASDPNLKKCWLDPFDPSRLALLFADNNATGVDDLVIVTGFGDYCIVRFTGGQRPGLLSKISNGLGIATTLEYETVANLDDAARKRTPWKTTLPVPARAVTRIATTNGLQGPLAQSYEAKYAYADPIYDTRDRAFLGFRQVTVTRRGDAAAPGTRTRTTFLTGTCPTVVAGNPCDPTSDYAYRVGRGLPGVVEVMDEGGDPQRDTHFVTTLYTYPQKVLYGGLDGRVVRRAWREAIDFYVWDSGQQDSTAGSAVLLPGDTPLGAVAFVLPNAAKHLRQTTHFDDFGNSDKVIDWGEVDRDGVTPLDKPIVTALPWALPPGETSGSAYRPTGQIIGYGNKLGHLLSATRIFEYAWNVRKHSPLGSARVWPILRL
jgi:Insecticide toxin TcdB middle/N-terminal region